METHADLDRLRSNSPEGRFSRDVDYILFVIEVEHDDKCWYLIIKVNTILHFLKALTV